MLNRREPEIDVNGLRVALGEAAAWCAAVIGDDADPRLWTSGLLDIDIAADESSLWRALTDAPDATLDTVVARRAERVALRPAPVRQRLDGRVLVCEYDCSLFDGASRAEAPGFVDLWDIPAWDTWIGLVPAGVLRAPGIDRLPALLAWIPMPLVPRAQSAIDVNPCEVLTWLDTRNRRLSRALLASA